MNRWIEMFKLPDFDPEYIAAVASDKLREKKKPMSPKGAIALALQDLGRNKLNEALEPILRSGNAVFLGMGDIMRMMTSDEEKTKLFIGFGSVLLGGIISALEDCVVDGWDYDHLAATLNRGLWGTPIEKFRKEDFAVNFPGQTPLSPHEESARIRRVLSQDKGTFIGFFEPDTRNLPGGLRHHLTKTQNIFFIKFALPFYEEAIRTHPKS